MTYFGGNMEDTMKEQLSDSETEQQRLIEYTVSIVLSYLAKHEVVSEDLVTLLHEVFEAVSSMNSKCMTKSKERCLPAVPIEESVFQEYIVCLEDGKKLKMLKRHLMNSYGMTPDDYRKKWGLPNNYPMVAPEYASRRSNLARTIGLGKNHSVGDASSKTN